jgi:hypothetical protein
LRLEVKKGYKDVNHKRAAETDVEGRATERGVEVNT